MRTFYLRGHPLSRVYLLREYIGTARKVRDIDAVEMDSGEAEFTWFGQQPN
ncbi:MAG: hypothetical protein J4F31_09640 [Flavobacteriales bacterium]|nr:hypothetical protein [Flavobacteriales bacterium]